MESNKKKPRKTRQTFVPKQGKRYTCIKCNQSFHSIPYFKDHIRQNSSCRSDFCCNFCSYIGYNERSFSFHLSSSSKCRYLYNESRVATGILPYAFESVQGPNNSQNSKSYRMMNNYLEETDNQSTILTIKD